MPAALHRPRVHDLLRLTPEGAALIERAPLWVSDAIRAVPWVVVRREAGPSDLVPIGIRGSNRSQRWADFVLPEAIAECISPAYLRSHQAAADRMNFPAITALRTLEPTLTKDFGSWGPGGSVGFELASGAPVVHPSSDLDLIFHARNRFDATQAQTLLSQCFLPQCRVDIRVETEACGFSLAEFAQANGSGILLRTCTGAVLATDPWSYAQGGPS